MKRLIAITCLVLTGLSWQFAALAQQSTSEEKRQNANLAAQLLIKELKEKTKTLGVDVNSLSGLISQQRDQHLVREESNGLSRKASENGLSQWYQTEADKILKRLDTNKPESVSTWFDGKERQSYMAPPAAEIKQNLDANFDQTFNQARSKATKDQWDRITPNTYPTETEVEEKSADDLKKILLDRLINAQQEPLFEENRTLAGKDFVGPVVEDAKKQLEAQSGIISDAQGGTEIVPEQITAEIQKQLDSYRNDLSQQKANTKVASKVYEVFPSVKAKVPTKVQSLAASKFANALSQLTFSAGKEDLKQIMAKDPAAHAQEKASRQICLDLYRANVVKLGIDKYAEKAPADKRQQFGEFLKGCLQNDATCQSQVQALVDRCLRDNFDPARKELAQSQLEEFFEPLAKGTWKPEVKDIDSRFDKQIVEIPEPFKLPGISQKPYLENQLLEETKSLVAEKEKQLIEQGLTAIHFQKILMEQVEKRLAGELQKAPTLPSEDELIKRFTDAVKNDWSKSADAKNYPELFDRIVKEIVVHAKALLPREQARRQEVQNQKEEEKKKQDEAAAKAEADAKAKADAGDKGKEGGNAAGGSVGGGGGGAGGGAGAGAGGGDMEKPKPEKFVPDIIIDLDTNDSGKVVVSINLIKVGKQATMVIEKQATEAQMTELRKLFGLVFSASRSAGQKEFWIYLRVFNRYISYGTVYDIRSCLEDVVEGYKQINKEISVYWYDKLFSDKGEKGKTEVPKDLKNKGMPMAPAPSDKIA